MKKTILKYLYITIIGLGLYCLTSDMATAQRGYQAVGGEAVFLLLPLLWGLVERIATDWVREIKEILK